MDSIISLSNQTLDIKIALRGAELQSLFNKQTNIEYLWNADPAFWAKKSPVLFPIVGGLKNNRYTYAGNEYNLGRHGFAREMDFAVTEQANSFVTLSISSTDATLAVYPFEFDFSIRYTLRHQNLLVEYIVTNTDEKDLLFSVGAHPAFRVPIVEGTTYEDYHLSFATAESKIEIYPLSPEGLIETMPVTLLENENMLPLTKQLFAKDALVFKNIDFDSVSILSNKNEHGVEVSFEGFSYLGIWAAKGADFVCIEPWCGVADSVNTTGKLEEKEGIMKFSPQATWSKSFIITPF